MNAQTSLALFGQIRHLVHEARERAARAVNKTMVELYWNIGRIIVEDQQGGDARAAYGEAVIEQLAAQLTTEFGRGFNGRNLRNMRAFYLAFPIWNSLSSKFDRDSSPEAASHTSRVSIRDSLRRELSWTHYRVLMRVSNESARLWYMNEAADAGWSVRALERQIGSHFYERLLASPDRAPVLAEAEKVVTSLATGPAATIKDPYIFEFLGLSSPRLLERDLESALLDNLQAFMLELGRGFSFVARQYRIATETSDFYIDLVFYNYRLRCFVVVDLKTGALTPQDIGQMDMYVRLFDEKSRQEGDRPTVGLVLCTHKDQTVVRYSVLRDNERLFASEYRLHLPSEEELKIELERERESLSRGVAINETER